MDTARVNYTLRLYSILFCQQLIFIRAAFFYRMQDTRASSFIYIHDWILWFFKEEK